MLTSYAKSAVARRALDRGALGYILKNSLSEEIIEGIRVVSCGDRFLCDGAEVLFRQRKSSPTALSVREREILKLIVEGYTLKEIADKLCLGFETVRSYCKYIHLKMGMNNTASVVRMAIEQKLV